MSTPKRARRDSLYCQVADEFTAVTGRKTYHLHAVLDWALANGKLDQPPPRSFYEYHLPRLAKALRHARDGKGARDYWCAPSGDEPPEGNGDESPDGNGEEAPGRQLTLWGNFENIDDDFAIHALMTRHNGVVRDVAQLQADLDRLNERRQARGRRPVQLSFDFTRRQDG
jgi:hypothetical protein